MDVWRQIADNFRLSRASRFVVFQVHFEAKLSSNFIILILALVERQPRLTIFFGFVITIASACVLPCSFTSPVVVNAYSALIVAFCSVRQSHCAVRVKMRHLALLVVLTVVCVCANAKLNVHIVSHTHGKSLSVRVSDFKNLPVQMMLDG